MGALNISETHFWLVNSESLITQFWSILGLLTVTYTSKPTLEYYANTGMTNENYARKMKQTCVKLSYWKISLRKFLIFCHRLPNMECRRSFSGSETSFIVYTYENVSPLIVYICLSIGSVDILNQTVVQVELTMFQRIDQCRAYSKWPCCKISLFWRNYNWGMGEYQDICRPEPPTYRGYTVSQLSTYYFILGNFYCMAI